MVIISIKQQCVRICQPDRTEPYRTVYFLERTVQMFHRFLFFFQTAISTVRSVNYYRFLVQTVRFAIFLTANRTVAKTKAFSIFSFNREPYRNQIRSVYRFIKNRIMVKTEKWTFFDTVRFAIFVISQCWSWADPRCFFTGRPEAGPGQKSPSRPAGFLYFFNIKIREFFILNEK